MEGGNYIVTWCVGHLAAMANAEAYDDKYAKWRYDDLPIVPQKWEYVPEKDKAKQFEVIRDLMNRDDVDEIINACDAGRKGELKTEAILDNVIAAYGKERVELILAATIREKAHDGRFSRDNKEWAASVPMPEGENLYLVSDRTHPILLDSIARPCLKNINCTKTDKIV